MGSATRRTTDAFGNPANPPGSQGTVQQPFGFTGQPQGGDGLVFLRGRSYVPALGRFLQRDPVAGDAAEPSSLNRSTYVRNNPASLTDPSGFGPAGIDDGAGSGMPGKSRALDDGSGDDQCRSSAGGNLAGYAVNARCLLFLAVGQATLTVRTELGTVTTPISFAAAPPPGGNGGGSNGRSEKQSRLRSLGSDPKASSADRGWIRQELNQIARGVRKTIRVPIGKVLAHRRGFEAKKGFSYTFSDLQDKILHDIQHKFEGY